MRSVSANWRSRRADSASSSLKASRLETQEELTFQGRKRLMSQLKAVRQEEFPFTQSFSALYVFN